MEQTIDNSSNVVITPDDTTLESGSSDTKQPDFTEMEDHGHIGVFKNFVKYDFCDTLIASFDRWYDRKYFKGESSEVVGKLIRPDGKTIDHVEDCLGEGEKQFPQQGGMGRQDRQFYLEVADASLAMGVNQAVGQAFEVYAKKYTGIIDSADPLSSWTCKVQKTDPGGGYHIWHCENGSYIYRDRVLTWMIYLNDIPYENGGGTDFFHQKISFQPTKGTLVLWPACYTHMHRGAFLTGDKSKYIATGWFLREPGNVTDRILGEAAGQLQPQDKMNPNI